eukprot:COSAG03_NODE_24331_length_273_cov_0.591954_1_plen_77_part_01
MLLEGWRVYKIADDDAGVPACARDLATCATTCDGTVAIRMPLQRGTCSTARVCSDVAVWTSHHSLDYSHEFCQLRVA